MTWGRRLALGAVAAVAGVAAMIAVRRVSLRWGASEAELRMPLPGDDFLAVPDLQATRAITISSPISHVWPWVAQLGQNRGGFYTYDWLENLVGCDIHTSNVIMPELRIRAVGDEVNLAPPVSLRVVAFEEARYFVLRGAVAADGTDADAPYDFTWAFVLIDDGPGTTRLIVRERYVYLTGWAGAVVEPVEMVSFLMSQRMLRGIRERAERPASTGPSNPPTVAGGIADDENPPVSNARERRPIVPPRWFVRLAWRVHRGVYRITGGRVGLWRPKPQGWGTLHLTTTGRRTGHDREVILGYFEDGPNLVTMAMNGWADPEPAWWLNLQTQPDAVVVVRDGPRLVHARAAQRDERARLWSRWREIDTGLDDLAALRSSETAVVVLEPRSAPVPTGMPSVGAVAAPGSPPALACR